MSIHWKAIDQYFTVVQFSILHSLYFSIIVGIVRNERVKLFRLGMLEILPPRLVIIITS